MNATMTASLRYRAVVVTILAAFLTALAWGLSGCTPGTSSADTRPLVQSIRADLVQQNTDLQAQNRLLQQQLAAIKNASNAAAATGSLIDQGIAWGSKALAAVGAIPDAVSSLQSQAKVLEGAKTSNAVTANELSTALANNSKLIATNAALAMGNGALTIKANAAAAQAATSEKEKTELRIAVAKYEAESRKHYNDIFGPKVHRIVKGIGIVTLVILGSLLVAVGVLGCMYGVPKITQPALTIGGKIINGVSVAAYYVGTFALSCLGPVGHWIDEHLFKHNQLKAQVAAIQHATPNIVGTNGSVLNVTTGPAAAPATV
jgi:hypothetical protein